MAYVYFSFGLFSVLDWIYILLIINLRLSPIRMGSWELYDEKMRNDIDDNSIMR